MIVLEVTDEVHAPKKENRPRNQVAWAHVLKADGTKQPHPQRVAIPLWREDSPYQAGTYTLAPQSIYVDKYGNLSLSPKLKPVTR